MVNRYLKKYSHSLIIRAVKVKITVRSHLTPVRMAVQGTEVQCWQRWREKGAQGSAGAVVDWCSQDGKQNWLS